MIDKAQMLGVAVIDDIAEPYPRNLIAGLAGCLPVGLGYRVGLGSL